MTIIDTNVALTAAHMQKNALVIPVALPSANGDLVTRILRVTPRAGWKQAFEEADANDELTNIPRFLVRVDNFAIKKESYNGTGAIWYRTDTYSNGTFNWRDESYNLSLATVDVEGKPTLVFSVKTVLVEDMASEFGDLLTVEEPATEGTGEMS